MKLSHLIILIFITSFSFAQNNDFSDIETHQVEKFILNKQIDSASFYFQKLKDSPYKDILYRIINKKPVSYAEIEEFISTSAKDKSFDDKIIGDYVNNNVKEPTDLSKINLDYVHLKWLQISINRDGGGLEVAAIEQGKLEEYINQFDENDTDVLRAKTRIKTYTVVLYLIERNLKGKELALECIEIAKQLNDIELQIAFLSHYSTFLIFEKKLEEYIKVNEECLALEGKLKKPSIYYFVTISNLVNAYIFKGDKNKRVLEILDELHKSPSKGLAYIYYLQLMSRLDKTSILKKEILDKFQVKSVLELVHEFIRRGEGFSPNNSFNLVNRSSRALAAHGFYKEAMTYKDQAIDITRKIYSEDLSNSIATHKTEQALQSKEKEIELEKYKTQFYSIIAILSSILFIITLSVLWKIRRQSRELAHKNQIINETLVEKELLVKEVHHRVKNNFQIISSLLEFQSEGIEEDKVEKLFNDGKNRVKSMALIHQKLYMNESGLIDFNDYIFTLTKEISFIYHSEVKVVTIILAEGIFFDLDTATPLGLIVNELLTNSYKYAFDNDKDNKIFIEIKKQANDTYKLIVEDNGVGISDNFNIKNSKSVGLRLVKRLVKQLHGEFKMFNNNGSRVEITFMDTNQRKHIE
jgi:two-component sensor histidine kinase